MQQIELAFSPGAFIRDRACFSFVSGLEDVAAQIDILLKTDAARAAGLYETFLADSPTCVSGPVCEHRLLPVLDGALHAQQRSVIVDPVSKGKTGFEQDDSCRPDLRK